MTSTPVVGSRSNGLKGHKTNSPRLPHLESVSTVSMVFLRGPSITGCRCHYRNVGPRNHQQGRRPPNDGFWPHFRARNDRFLASRIVFASLICGIIHLTNPPF